MTSQQSSIPDGGQTLASGLIRHEQDVVSLRRWTRAAAEQVSLSGRDVRSISAATYEAAHVLLTQAGVATSDVRLTDGPSLQVLIRVDAASPADAAVLRDRLAPGLQSLRAMVHRFDIDLTGQGVAVRLVMFFPSGSATRVQNGMRQAAVQQATGDGLEQGLLEENIALHRAQQELYVELQETNRGVIAMYAELEDQAERLRQAEDRLRLLLDSVQDYAICMLTADGEITSWNSGAERLFGYSADEIVGQKFACFFTPSERDLDAPVEQLRAAEEYGRFECEGLRVRRGGSAFDAHVVLTPVRRARELRGFSLVVRDVTERKRLEDDLRSRADELAAANRAKEDFLATLSHELRTPLNAMLGWTRLLRMGKLDRAAMARALETIERNAHLQEQLIADILDVSRIVTGKLRLELRPMELSPILEAAVDALRPAADAKSIQLACDIGGTNTVMADPDRLQQVIWNLLSNGIKFTPSGGEIRLSLGRIGPNAVITVADSGEGIAPELLPYIFDRFTQGDASVTRPHGGLGLGLSIVRHIVELHGGKVQAWSDGPGRGSTFSVFLPVRAVQVAEPGVAERSCPPLSGVKVLVVDDDPDARDVVSMALAQCGARTAAVSSVQEALQMLPDFRPDVLVSDIGMPGEDGYSLIRRIRALGDGFGDVPAIALTAFANPDDKRRALSAGYQQFVPKPVQVSELAAVVRTLASK